MVGPRVCFAALLCLGWRIEVSQHWTNDPFDGNQHETIWPLLIRGPPQENHHMIISLPKRNHARFSGLIPSQHHFYAQLPRCGYDFCEGIFVGLFQPKAKGKPAAARAFSQEHVNILVLDTAARQSKSGQSCQPKQEDKVDVVCFRLAPRNFPHLGNSGPYCVQSGESLSLADKKENCAIHFHPGVYLAFGCLKQTCFAPS